MVIQLEKERSLLLQYCRGEHTEICPRNIFKITGKKSGYGITHSIYSLIGVSLSMEPKSIAFYTAVAVSILAVISATTFPSLALAQPDGQGQPTHATDSANTVDENDPKADSAESNDNSDEGGATENNGAGRQSLGLDPSSGVASCGQVVTEDTILTSDLECGPGDGLTVGADNVAIDLNGYKITSADETDSADLATGYDG